MNSPAFWKIITAVELAVLFAMFIPTLVILGLLAVSLLVRREGIATLGFKRAKSGLGMAGFVFLSVVVLQLFQIGFTMPVLNHLTGTRIDYGGFADLKGNLGRRI